MYFSVKIRKPDGGLEARMMESSSRAQLISILKKEGVSPISVTSISKKEAGNISSKAPSLLKGIATCVCVVFTVLAACLFLMQDKPEIENDAPIQIKKRGGLAKEVKPAAAPVPIKETIEKVIETNAPFAYLKDLTPEERRAEIRRLNEEKPIDLTQPTNRTFATGTEQVISWIFTTSPGDMPPLLPNLPDFELAHLQEILEHRNVVFEGDDEKTEDAKRTVDMVKEYLKEYVDKGGDPQKFLQFYRDELQQAFETRLAAQKQVMQVIREEPEIAAEFINEVNAELDKKNIKHVRIPPPLRKRLGLE